MSDRFLRLREVCNLRGVHALSHLAALEQIRPGVLAQDLAVTLGMGRSSVDRVLSSLSDLGLISRQRVTDREMGDLRTANLSLTPDGESLLARMRGIP